MPDSNPLEQPRLPGWSTEALVSRLLEGPGRLFAVVNAARDAQVLMAVRGLGIEQLCLYAGDEAIRLAAYAPYLLSFGDTPHPLARYLDLGWFQQWGIFLRSALSVEAVASHLAGFMTVRVPGDHEAYFRFYDPWVLSLGPFRISEDRGDTRHAGEIFRDRNRPLPGRGRRGKHPGPPISNRPAGEKARRTPPDHRDLLGPG